MGKTKENHLLCLLATSIVLTTAAAGTSTAQDRDTDNPQAEVSHGLPLPLAKGGTEVT